MRRSTSASESVLTFRDPDGLALRSCRRCGRAPPTAPATCCSRGPVGGRSRSVYTGLIRVGKEARGTNAFQTNRNIKLSDHAWAESIPNLDDREQRRALQPRLGGRARSTRSSASTSRAGACPPTIAERLIVAGFFAEVLDRAARVRAWRPLLARTVGRASSSRRDAVMHAKSPSAPLDELEPGTARRFDVDGRAIAVVRLDDDVYAIGDVCCHAETSRCPRARSTPTSATIECWKHGSEFSLETGEPQSLPATKPGAVYEVRVVDGQIEVSW